MNLRPVHVIIAKHCEKKSRISHCVVETIGSDVSAVCSGESIVVFYEAVMKAGLSFILLYVFVLCFLFSRCIFFVFALKMHAIAGHIA